MNNIKTIYELTEEEFEELRVIMLYDDENEFYEDIDEISDDDVIRRFENTLFRPENFSCNYATECHEKPAA
ncbi:MAG: hypothetical protein J5685_07175 [Clostridiales bacterium]|nr:hypothetical protein [Clostridiales bacterium]